MEESNNNINALVRSGTTQDDRYRSKLSPGNIKLDDRTVSDFILFAKRYGKYIKYYREDNTVEGNWEDFWNSDISAILATLSGYEIEDYQNFYSGLKKHLVDIIEDNSLNAAQRNTALGLQMKLLFHLTLNLVRELSVIYPKLQNEGTLQSTLLLLMKKEIQGPLDKFVSYYKGAVNDTLVGTFNNGTLTMANFPANDYYIRIPDIIRDAIVNIPVFSTANIQLPYTTQSWAVYYGAITANDNPFSEGISTSEKVFDSLNYNLFINSIESLFQGMIAAINVFKRELGSTLENYPEHPAHYALWLTFIRLYQNEQVEINKITERHLIYYYTDVLKQIPRAPKANKANLIFELSKDVPKYLLEKGTLFKAGKDGLGRVVNYKLTEDFLINRAKISDLKSFYHEPNKFAIAAEKVDTKDGIKTKLDSEYPYWSPFYKGNPELGMLTPKARMGFAIADKNLFLKEGTRNITIGFDAVLPEGVSGGSDFIVYYTTIKGWQIIAANVNNDEVEYTDPVERFKNKQEEKEYKKDDGSVEKQSKQKAESKDKEEQHAYSNAPSEGSTIKVTITPDLPAFVHYDKSIHVTPEHTDVINTNLPVMKVMVNQHYDGWKGFEFNIVSLDVKVEGVKDFVLQNKDGIADTSKPFFIFGAIPDKEPGFTIGSNEVLSKKLSEFTLQFEWLEQYNTTNYLNPTEHWEFGMRAQYLQNGKWSGEANYSASPRHLLQSTTKLNTEQFGSVIGAQSRFPEQKLKNDLLTSTSKHGFVAFHVGSLNGYRNFGHLDFQDRMTKYLISISNTITTDDISLPKEPYPAKVASLYIDYETKSKRPDLFFELHPFGYRYNSNPRRVMPLYANKGELYIGITELVLPAKLSTLFQVRTGTANPLSDAADVHWSYLRNNQWIEGDLQVDDKTDELSGSGIIGFIIPKDASTIHTVMPTGRHWIKMSVAENDKALNDLISIDAQVATVEFFDQNNDPSFLNGQIEAETISKLVDTVGAIKKITQKYASFDGAGAEANEDYYVRVSERLRHKNRAINIWDYEHLVLQQFPRVYKVKCLNHTEIDNGLKPGHVTIIPIPRIETILKDPLRPYTDRKTRIDILRYLKARTSAFVCLHVEQPKLESVQVKFDVVFNDDIVDLVFYKQKLNDALIRHLSPWAFNDGMDISFGGRWYKADLINFIDEQPYVNYITDFQLFHHLDAEATTGLTYIDTEVAEASTQRSILVSARQHLITSSANDNNVTAEDTDCICSEC